MAKVSNRELNNVFEEERKLSYELDSDEQHREMAMFGDDWEGYDSEPDTDPYLDDWYYIDRCNDEFLYGIEEVYDHPDEGVSWHY